MTDQLSNLLELLAVACSVVYVLLAARSSIWCWLFGLLSSVLYAVVFTEVRLYSDALLQVYYCVMSVYGWWTWKHRETSVGQGGRGIVTLRPIQHVFLVAGGFALALPLGWFWSLFGASLPYLDAMTTSFAVLTTVLVARKVLENWMYWIVIDLVAGGMYVYKGLLPTAILFGLFTMIALYGFRRWRQLYRIGKVQYNPPRHN